MGFFRDLFNDQKHYDQLKAELPESEDSYRVENQAPQSWDPVLHPNGREGSSYVAEYSYDGDKKELSVTYTNGFTAIYPDIEKSLVEEFNRAPSKGRFAVQRLHPLPYREG